MERKDKRTGLFIAVHKDKKIPLPQGEGRVRVGISGKALNYCSRSRTALQLMHR